MTLETLLKSLTPDTPITEEEMRFYEPVDKVLAEAKPYRVCCKCGEVLDSKHGNTYYCEECQRQTISDISNEWQKIRRKIEKREVTVKCVICNTHFIAESKRAKYCPLCRSYADEYNQKYRKSKKGTVKEYIAKMREICDSKDVINIKRLIKYGGE